MRTVRVAQTARAALFALDNDGARTHAAAADKLADPELYDVAAAQLAVEREVEHRATSHALFVVEPEPDGSDLLRFKGPFGAELPPSVPRAATLEGWIVF